MVGVGVNVKGKLSSSTSGFQQMKQPKPKSKTVATDGVSSFKIFAEPNGNPKLLDTHHHSLLKPEAEEECNTRKPSFKGGRHFGAAGALKSGQSYSEKNKGKLQNSGNPNVGRKVLADISNVRTSFSRAKVPDRSKSLGSSRSLLVGTHAGSYASRKPFNQATALDSFVSMKQEIVRTDSTQVTVNHPTAERGCKEMKETSDDLKTKTQSRQLVKTVNIRKYDGSGLPPSRKSFPVNKLVSKELTERSLRCKEKYGIPVNPKVGRNVASRFNNCKGRASDGYIMMASKGQLNKDVGAVSRRSLKPMLPRPTTTSKMKRISNSKSVSGFHNPALGSDISYEEKDEKAKLSSTGNIESALLDTQLNEKEVSSLSKCKLEKTTAENVATRKSGRRKSFTSLLMSRSKEDLLNIYDARNHLEVTEYVDDIYQYYWVMEAQNQPLKQYMEIQSEITPQMRGILINWLVEVHLKFDLMRETLFLMVTLLDQFLSIVSIEKNKMQLVGLTALLLASKYEDFWHPRIIDLIGVSANSYTRDDMLRMENAFLKTLKFRLNAPTPYVFMLRFIRAAQSDKTFEHLAFYLIELCTVEYEALKYKPSLLCAAAIYLARCTMGATPTWTPLLAKHTRYEEHQIRECSEMIWKFHRAAETAVLRVTYDKYMRVDLSRVAAMKPLDMLPDE